MGIFPSFAEDIIIEQNKTMPMATDIAIDFDSGEPLIVNGDFVKVYGNDAIKVWCYFALKTAKGRFLAFTKNYGSELEEKIISKNYDSNTNNELKRIVEDCLLVNKYIKKIDNVTSSFEDNELVIEIELTTLYGGRVTIIYGE